MINSKLLREMHKLVEDVEDTDWEVIAVSRDKKSGKVKNIQVFDSIEPTSKRSARKLAWAHDTRPDLYSVRIRQVGDSGIGEPHDWQGKKV